MSTSSGSVSLWEALGRPARHLPMPRKASHEWRTARLSLAASLAQLGCYSPPPSWQRLWCLLHGPFIPAFVCWGRLCGNFSLMHLIDCIRAQSACPVALWGWNARWIIDMHARKNKSKRAVILTHLCAAAAIALSSVVRVFV